jgi:hypothetical protein
METPTFDKLQLIKYDELPYFKAYFNDFVVVYTMTGCHWCTKCMPEVMAAIEEKNPSIPILHILFNDDKSILKKEKIDGFPTIRRYKDEEFLEFDEARTKDNFLKFFA